MKPRTLIVATGLAMAAVALAPPAYAQSAGVARTILLAGVLALWSMPALAQARPERLFDKDVKTLIDQVDQGRDKFEGNLDGNFKGSTVRGATGEVKVSGALQDYQDNTKKLQQERPKKDLDLLIKLADSVKSRTSGGQPATAEVRQLSEQMAKLEGFAGAHSALPMANWQAVRTSFGRLQQAFGLTP